MVRSLGQATVIITGKIFAVAIKYAEAKLNVWEIKMPKRYSNPLMLDEHFHNKQVILNFKRDKLRVLIYFALVKVPS